MAHSPKQTIKGKSTWGRIVFQSTNQIDKEELGRIKNELDDLKVDEMDLNEEDDRDYMVNRLNDVNR